MLNLLLKKWEYRNMTIVKIFSEVVDQHPDKIAFQFENEKWTFKQVNACRIVNENLSQCD